MQARFVNGEAAALLVGAVEKVGESFAAQAPAEQQPARAAVSGGREIAGEIFHAAAAGEFFENGMLQCLAGLHQRQGSTDDSANQHQARDHDRGRLPAVAKSVNSAAADSTSPRDPRSQNRRSAARRSPSSAPIRSRTVSCAHSSVKWFAPSSIIARSPADGRRLPRARGAVQPQQPDQVRTCSKRTGQRKSPSRFRPGLVW
jgi:hypothetical protein